MARRNHKKQPARPVVEALRPRVLFWTDFPGLDNPLLSDGIDEPVDADQVLDRNGCIDVSGKFAATDIEAGGAWYYSIHNHQAVIQQLGVGGK